MLCPREYFSPELNQLKLLQWKRTGNGLGSSLEAIQRHGTQPKGTITDSYTLLQSRRRPWMPTERVQGQAAAQHPRERREAEQ